MAIADRELVDLLRWASPRLGLRWKGIRGFRGTVRKRLNRRLAELGLADLAAYRARLEADPSEWVVLDGMCRIPISRFYRDRLVFDRLAREILPACARRAAGEGRAVRVWSAGCAAGEEPYSVALVWHLEVAPAHPGTALELVATDASPEQIARARRGCYAEGSLRELPDPLRAAAFERVGDEECVRGALRAGVRFELADLRERMPEGAFDVVLCRNVVLTYVDEALQRPIVERMIARLRPGGFFVVGAHERMPDGVDGLATVAACVHERRPTPAC